MSRDTSPYIVGDYWLDKRRDGKSPFIWQIATGTRHVSYRSTRSSDLELAKGILHAHVDALRAKGKQGADEAAAIPLLFLYWKEHGKGADSAGQIASSIRQFIGFLDQDTLSAGLDIAVSELDFPMWRRFREWRMAPHSYAVPWFGKLYSHSSNGVNGESVQRNLDDLKAGINHHVNAGRLTAMPKVPPVPDDLRSKPRDLVLSISQLGAIVGYCRELGDAGMLRWVLLMIATDMRPEAALAMDPSAQFMEDFNLLDLHPPKWPVTVKVNPVVPLLPDFKPVLLDWRATPHAPVKSRKTAWRTMRAALGLPGMTIPKTIRHSIATKLRTMRVPKDEIETLMGHRVLKSTTAVYAKYDPDYLRAVTKALSKVWREVWSASDEWIAVHMLSTPIRGKPLEVIKRS